MTILFAVALVAAASQAAGSAVPGSAAPAADKSEQRVCRRIQFTGSNLPGKKYCLTRAEWRSLDAQSDAANDAVRNRGRIGPVPVTL